MGSSFAGSPFLTGMKPSFLPVLGVALLTLALGSPQSSAADLQTAVRKAFAEADFQRKFDDWKQLGDDTIVSRLAGMCRVVRVEGPDGRLTGRGSSGDSRGLQ